MPTFTIVVEGKIQRSRGFRDKAMVVYENEGSRKIEMRTNVLRVDMAVQEKEKTPVDWAAISIRVGLSRTPWRNYLVKNKLFGI